VTEPETPPLNPIDPARSTTITPLRVRFCETDLMGIVHHGAYLVYFEVGRVEWLRRRGVTYADWASRGVHLPVVEVHVNYKIPVRFDDLLDIETTLTQLRTVSLKFGYKIRRGADTVAEGWTRLGCIDDQHGLLRLPGEMRDVLLSGELPA
jgi:acyl-CoA thioester hydrolase